MRSILSAALLTLAVAGACRSAAQSAPAPRVVLPPPRSLPAIAPDSLRTRLYTIADDSMRGRLAGSEGDYETTAYIASELQRFGLVPAGEGGGYFQTVPIHLRGGVTPPRPARNVIAILPGSDPTLRGEYVSISAHNDHVGVARAAVDHDSLRIAHFARERIEQRHEPEAEVRAWAAAALDSLQRAHPARRDSIYNGADDDGSGTVALLEIARTLASAPQRPRRSILFVSHTAEELGLVGSRWYTDHPTVPRDSIVAELDLDMVGRGDAADLPGGGPTYLELIGTRRLSTELGDIAEAVNARQQQPFHFNYAFDAPGHPEQYYCRADHFSYARYGIPSINFSRGDHPDYHQVTDEPQYIDYDALARVATYVRDLATTLADLDHRPRLDKPKPDPFAPCVQ